MSILKKKETVAKYQITPEQIKSLIAKDLEVNESRVDVKYVIREVGGDPLDRYPCTPTVTEISVTVKGETND